MRFVAAPESAVVLDYGAGTGAYALPFKRQRPDCTVLALDIEAGMLDLLRAKQGGTAIETGGHELLERYGGRIDRVLAVNVLHELEDEHLAELVAALAPDARVAMIDWNADVERPAGPAKEHLFGPAGAAEYLARFGLAMERTREFPYHYALLLRRGDAVP